MNVLSLRCRYRKQDIFHLLGIGNSSDERKIHQVTDMYLFMNRFVVKLALQLGRRQVAASQKILTTGICAPSWPLLRFLYQLDLEMNI